MKRLLAILLVLTPVFALKAQKTTLFSWDVSLNTGYMMPNNTSYSDNSSLTLGLDITLWSRGIDSSYWRVHRNFPFFGIKASFSAIPNSPAGDRFGITGLLQQPFEKSSRWAWSFGLGLSVYTRPRSITGDTNNIFIGSLVNCLIDIGLTFRPAKQLYLSAHVLHTSNGMLMWPNMGLNYIQLDLGYSFGNRIPEEPYTETGSAALPRNEFGLAFSPGWVMSRDRDFDGYYFCYDLSLYLQHYTSPTFAFGGAVDLWYNTCDTRHLDREEGAYQLPLYISAMAMMEFFWGPLSIKAGAGPVLLCSPQVTTPFYERAGAYYNFGKNYVGVAVNAHGGRVEFIEWTYGRRFGID